MEKTEKVVVIAAIAVLAMLTPLYKYVTAKIVVGIMFTLFALITAFLYWLVTGRRRSFEKELLSEKNRNRGEAVGIIFILLVIGLLIYINNR